MKHLTPKETYAYLQANPEVLGLISRDPFDGKKPQYIRARLYEYHFTKPGTGDHNWWKRELLGTYLPPVSLRR